MTPTTILFDIETSSLSESELLDRMPEFEAAKNLVDPTKIKAARLLLRCCAWAERFCSADGEHKTMISGQISFEPLAAADLFSAECRTRSQ